MATDNLGFDVNPSGTNLFILQVAFLAFAWFAALLRAYVKLVMLRKVTVDDYLMLLALLGYTITGYFVTHAIIEGGLGKPAVESDLVQMQIQLQSLYGNMAISGPVSGLARVSTAWFLLRIATRRWQRIALYGIIIATTITTLVYFFFTVFQCSPPSYFWRMMGPGVSGTCDFSRAVYLATLVWGSLAAAMDWMLGLLPAIILWHVHINWLTKVGITSVLSFTTTAGIALIVRLIYVSQNGEKVPLGTTAVAITAIVELSLAIVAGCIVTLPPLFKKLRLGSRRRSSGTLPWQKSLIEPMPLHMHMHRSVENIIMASPRRVGGPSDNMRDMDMETQYPRAGTSCTSRAPSSNWDYEIEAGGMGDGEPVPSGREIQVRTFISVTSQPSADHVPVRDVKVNLDNKPLPMLPPQPRLKDRPILKSRSRNPSLFI
ncbi:hypothetical protein GGR50DRAFT_559917 [Xylaria sp. CBS 124048]|nr:hypothetical protein GGR50DRAFT_559917 [Xylaria sp. CBS 124048]